MSAETVQAILEAKTEGNKAYQAGEYSAAISGYSKAVKLLPCVDYDSDDPADCASMKEIDPELRKQAAIVLCNRAAAYMGLKKPIPALADAQLASESNNVCTTHALLGDQVHQIA